MSASARRPASLRVRDGVVHEIIGLRHDGGDDHLPGREPEGQLSGVVLDHDADEPLEGAEDRTVKHDGPVFLAIRADVIGIQPLGQVEIGLEGAALPFTPDRVGQLEVELGAVERAFARVDLVVVADRQDRLFQRAFGLVPDLVGAHAHLGPGRQLDVEAFETRVR
jgi:hypothetical protein